ncbi:hypothetical protein [Mangrovicoccus sp. HB161399]|uniref:hypothetical protein n=1 Tax=Mangrovicoccus sp. HB161399 TaxID=2720392 RepID=UPI00155165C8|nr:hypothetical protein [Mangrovicoccus sp. HB161399]
MFEALSSEVLVGGSIIGISALATCMGYAAMVRHRPQPRPVDIDQAVKNAPYENLSNVVKIEPAKR